MAAASDPKEHPLMQCCLCDNTFRPSRNLTTYDAAKVMHARGWRCVAPGTFVCSKECLTAGMRGLELLANILGHPEPWRWIRHRADRR